MVVNFSDVVWAQGAGFSMKVIRLALKEVADGAMNFPDALVWHDLFS
jgi:hypothetical protein